MKTKLRTVARCGKCAREWLQILPLWRLPSARRKAARAGWLTGGLIPLCPDCLHESVTRLGLNKPTKKIVETVVVIREGEHHAM